MWRENRSMDIAAMVTLRPVTKSNSPPKSSRAGMGRSAQRRLPKTASVAITWFRLDDR